MNNGLKELINIEKKLGSNPFHSYSVDTLEILDEYINKEKSVDKLKEFKSKASSSYYENGDNPGSISLRYIIGRLNQIIKPHEAQTMLSNLITDFHNKSNMSAALFVAEKLLETNEDVAALSVKAESEKENGNEENVWSYYERIVKVDLKNVTLLCRLAEHYKNEGKEDKAKSSYEKALSRAIKNLKSGNKDESAKSQIEIKELFTILLQEESIDYSFFSSSIFELNSETNLNFILDLCTMLNDDIEKRVSTLSEENIALKRKYLDFEIKNLRYMLLLRDKDTLRDTLGATLKNRYSSSSRFSQLYSKFNWKNMRENVIEMLDEFLKNIAYARGVYVLQKNSGKVGLIYSISQDGEMEIIFSTINNDKAHIKVDNALGFILPLSSRDIRAIKKGKKSEDIKKKILSPGGDEWLLKTMLLSLDYECTFKDMESYIVPSILTKSEWENEQKKMKKIAENDPYIDNLDKGKMILRDVPSGKEDRTYTTFKTMENDKKISLFLSLLEEEDVDLSNTHIQTMVDDLGKITRSLDDPSLSFETIFALEKIGKDGIYPTSSLSFEELYSALSEKQINLSYEKLSLKNKDIFISHLKEIKDKPFSDILNIFSYLPSDSLRNEMQRLDKTEYSKYVSTVMSNPRNNLKPFIYFVSTIDSFSTKNIEEKYLPNLDSQSISFIENELNALSYAYQEHFDEKSIMTLKNNLLKDNKLNLYIEKIGQEGVKNTFIPLLENKSLFSEGERNMFSSLISSLYPELVIKEDSNKEENIDYTHVKRGFFCTKESYEKKRNEAEDIKNVQIPKVDKEIKDARSLGDLRENAEYQYAKEHKSNLDRALDTLSQELSSVTIMKKEDVSPDRVGFGTKVTLLDLDENKEIVYTFLGRWESKPEENVIDINAPLSLSLLDKMVGERAEFKNGRIVKHFLIKKILVLDF